MKNILEFETFLETIKPIIGTINQSDYTHYVINTKDNKIWSGWSYESDAKDFIQELQSEYPKSKLKVYSKIFLIKNRINPDDDSIWTNNDEMKTYM
mgnify:CR=1 FL=1